MGGIDGGPIRFAFIGCGQIANKHAVALGRLDGARVVGAYDIDAGAARRIGEKYSVPHYADLDRMVGETDPQVFVVLTPSGDHADRVLDLVRFGRHFVVEKPLALRLDHVDRILSVCDAKGLKIFVVKQNRFNPPIRKLRESLDAGRFGKPVLGTVRVRWKRDQAYYDQKPWRGTWAQDGGVLTNQASHHIDMLVWLMGDVESVMAKTCTRLVDIEAEDVGVAILKFRSGALGIIEALTAARPKDIEGSISVLGEKGSVEIGGFFMNEIKNWSFAEPDGTDREVLDKYASTPLEPAWNHTEFFRDVLDSLNNGRRGLIDGLEGRKSIELINAIYESAETGKEVYLRFVPRNCRLGVRP